MRLKPTWLGILKTRQVRSVWTSVLLKILEFNTWRVCWILYRCLLASFPLAVNFHRTIVSLRKIRMVPRHIIVLRESVTIIFKELWLTQPWLYSTLLENLLTSWPTRRWIVFFLTYGCWISYLGSFFGPFTAVKRVGLFQKSMLFLNIVRLFDL